MPKKLIEVALPLTQINEASVAEKKLRSGMPANIHAWWARRPLAASRAVVFAQLVDDPSEHPERFKTEDEVLAERERLFELIRRLVNPKGPDSAVLAEAQKEINASIGSNVVVLDPFAGGGSIPIEAQRLGLNVESSDLNPVAVLLNRILLDQVRCAINRPSVHPLESALLTPTPGNGLHGLAEDVKWFGRRLRDLADQEVGYLYPNVKDEEGREYPVIAWIWARTVPCSNPACRRPAPLVANLWLSTKKGRNQWLEPVVGPPGEPIAFQVKSGTDGPAVSGSKVGRGVRFKCLGCGEGLTEQHVRESGKSGRMSHQLMAVATLGDRRRVYFDARSDLSPSMAELTVDSSELDVELPNNPRAISPPGYGMSTHSSLYTKRQLKTLLTIARLLPNIHAEVVTASGGDVEYANLLVSMLGLSLSKLADLNNTLCWWEAPSECPRNLFTRQAIPMMWDFAEANPLGDSSGSFLTVIENSARALTSKLVDYERDGHVAQSQGNASTRDYPDGVVVCTDPPYFDNIGYADVADFFYVWLRAGLKGFHPDLFSTLLTPKAEELVAIPYRHADGRTGANRHFESGFREVFARIREAHNAEIPMTLFYAYKQEDEERSEESSTSGAGATGWEKLLQGMVDSNLQVTATWPIRTEMVSRLVGRGANALASSVVLACRARDPEAGITDRQGFIRHLRRHLSEKLPELQSGGVQPVDMAQASIGPGMAVFTSYAKVLEGGDQQMTVGSALQIINQVLDELQSEQESELDPDTRWAVTWFTQNGMNSGEFGDAQNIATARGTAVNALERSGIVEARAGRVRLLSRSEYANDWDPATDKRLTVWEVCQQLIRRVEGDGGLMSAAALLRQVGNLGEAARDLAYRLYEIANRNGWSDEARAYNNLAAEWPDLVALASQSPSDPETLF